MKIKKLFFFPIVYVTFFSLKIFSNTIEIRSYKEYTTLKKNNPNIIVQCYANWCPACKKAMPTFDAISEHEMCKNIICARINIDKIPKIKKELSLIGVPTFVFIKNGQQAHLEIGIKNFDAFENHMLSLIKKHL